VAQRLAFRGTDGQSKAHRGSRKASYPTPLPGGEIKVNISFHPSRKKRDGMFNSACNSS